MTSRSEVGMDPTLETLSRTSDSLAEAMSAMRESRLELDRRLARIQKLEAILEEIKDVSHDRTRVLAWCEYGLTG